MSIFFPGMGPELDYKIVSYLEDSVGDLISLSAVNNTAHYCVLPNDPFFQALFKDHSLYEMNYHSPNPKFPDFYSLQLVFPNNCWKIAARIFQSGACRRELGHYCVDLKLKKEIPRLDFKEYGLFSYIYQALAFEKSEALKKLTSICGNGYEDPNSPIDQAWKVEEMLKESKKLSALCYVRKWKILTELAKITPDLGRFYSVKKDKKNVLNLFKNNSDALAIIEKKFEERPGNDRIIVEQFDDNEGKPIIFHRALIAQYQQISSIYKDLKPVSDQLDGYSDSVRTQKMKLALLKLKCREVCNVVLMPWEESVYKALEHTRCITEDQILILKGAFNYAAYSEKNWEKFGEIVKTKTQESFQRDYSYWLPKTPYVSCEEILTEKWEKRLPGIISQLQSISNFLKLEMAESECIDVIFNICNLPLGYRTYIWKTLYDRCANDIDEPNWSINHFHEHLPELIKIVNETIERLKTNAKYFGVDLSSRNRSLI